MLLKSGFFSKAYVPNLTYSSWKHGQSSLHWHSWNGMKRLLETVTEPEHCFSLSAEVTTYCYLLLSYQVGFVLVGISSSAIFQVPQALWGRIERVCVCVSVCVSVYMFQSFLALFHIQLSIMKCMAVEAENKGRVGRTYKQTITTCQQHSLIVPIFFTWPEQEGTE